MLHCSQWLYYFVHDHDWCTGPCEDVNRLGLLCLFLHIAWAVVLYLAYALPPIVTVCRRDDLDTGKHVISVLISPCCFACFAACQACG